MTNASAGKDRGSGRWTNRSVKALAQDRDPVQLIIALARQTAIEALDKGWIGPPFDPISLAEILGHEVAANTDIRDARTVPAARGRVRIEFNPSRPRGRMRYSIAHEIAHTLFPDVGERIRNRAAHAELQGDDWQLEALCNIAAAELLMPYGALAMQRPQDLTAHAILELRKRFDVSTEALVIRLAETSEGRVAAFCASPTSTAVEGVKYRLDYVIGSNGWRPGGRSTRLPDDSAIRECTAIGYSARGLETWWEDLGKMQVEAIGIPPYPGSGLPRVVGLLRVSDRTHSHPAIKYVHGNATDPRGSGLRMVVQVVNDKTANWGGGGFASAVRRAWPVVQRDFKEWAEGQRSAFKLGAVRLTEADDRTLVASIVAQHGYGPSPRPRVRYTELREGLRQVARLAIDRGATIHLPRIGTGQAGGSWNVVRDLVVETLISAGLHVTVYDLPGSSAPAEPQLGLSLSQTEDA
ncbi:MAG: ImmA/IrrE family metallo-endopeptidase [Candidatus Eisenbacteria bacterium]|nr:ImmA/IrrE family metallo-endopeptidase [Candidatus Eisenbacteria bacterium]